MNFCNKYILKILQICHIIIGKLQQIFLRDIFHNIKTPPPHIRETCFGFGKKYGGNRVYTLYILRELEPFGVVESMKNEGWDKWHKVHPPTPPSAWRMMTQKSVFLVNCSPTHNKVSICQATCNLSNFVHVIAFNGVLFVNISWNLKLIHKTI